MKARTLSRRLSEARTRAETQHLAAMTAIYQTALRQAAIKAHAQYRAITAAADWQPPPDGAILTTAELKLLADRLNGDLAQTRQAIILDLPAPTLARLGIAWDIAHPLAQSLLAQAGQRTGVALGEAVHPVLRKTIADAYTAGLSVTDTAAMIHAELTAAAPWQAEMLARTDLNGLANGASLAAGRLVGVGFKTWLATLDERTRPTHADAHGQTVPVDAPFDVGGENLDYPGDPNGSDEAVCNCRCALALTDTLEEGGGLLAAGGGIIMDRMAATRRHGRQHVGRSAKAARKAVQLKAAATGTDSLPAGVTACTLGKTPGYTGGGLCHVHDGSEAGMRSAMRKAQGDAAKRASNSAAVTSAPTEDATGSGVAWEGVLCVEGVPTADNSDMPRVMLPDSITWRDLPLTLMAMTVTAEGHDGAQVAGRIDRIWREPAPQYGAKATAIMGGGEFTTPFGISEIAPMVADQTLRGVSVDFVGSQWAIVDAKTLEVVPEAELNVETAMARGYLTGLTKGVIGATTVCPLQALDDTQIALVASGSSLTLHRDSDLRLTGALVAAAAPAKPPLAWFQTQEPPGKMPLTITDEGRVFGHLASWDSCHMSFLPACIPPPQSASRYAYFHVGELATAEGTKVPVGKLMVGGRHAGIGDSREDAMRHYDNTSRVGAYLRAVDGKHGIWVCGSLNPALTDGQVAELRANPPSGDWRPVKGSHELIAGLSVPVPGFATPRADMELVASGGDLKMGALVAALGPTVAEPAALAALEDAGLMAVRLSPEELEADRRISVLAAKAQGIDALAALAEGTTAPPAPVVPPVKIQPATEPFAEEPATDDLDDQVAAALGTLASVTQMATRVEAAEQRANELADLVEQARREQVEQTATQKRETLAAIESMTAQIAAGGKISEAMLAAVGQLADRRPRQVTVVRDEQGRAQAYEVA